MSQSGSCHYSNLAANNNEQQQETNCSQTTTALPGCVQRSGRGPAAPPPSVHTLAPPGHTQKLPLPQQWLGRGTTNNYTPPRPAAESGGGAMCSRPGYSLTKWRTTAGERDRETVQQIPFISSPDRMVMHCNQWRSRCRALTQAL